MNLAYVAQDSNERLENTEWDYFLVRKARYGGTPRIVMIGDSITQGIQETYHDIIGLPWPVDSYTTSKVVDSPYLIPMIKPFVDQEFQRNVIIL